jgi:hypothetical protein
VFSSRCIPPPRTPPRTQAQPSGGPPRRRHSAPAPPGGPAARRAAGRGGRRRRTQTRRTPARPSPSRAPSGLQRGRGSAAVRRRQQVARGPVGSGAALPPCHTAGLHWMGRGRGGASKQRQQAAQPDTRQAPPPPPSPNTHRHCAHSSSTRQLPARHSSSPQQHRPPRAACSSATNSVSLEVQRLFFRVSVMRLSPALTSSTRPSTACPTCKRGARVDEKNCGRECGVVCVWLRLGTCGGCHRCPWAVLRCRLLHQLQQLQQLCPHPANQRQHCNRQHRRHQGDKRSAERTLKRALLRAPPASAMCSAGTSARTLLPASSTSRP